MAIPGFQRMMLPILEFCQSGDPVNTAELSAMIADRFELTEEDRSLTLDSGKLKYKNRVAWAAKHLSGAGLLDKIGESEFKITDAGLEVLINKPEKFDLKFLDRFPAHLDFRQTYSSRAGDEASFPSRLGRTRVTLRLPSTLVDQAKLYCAMNRKTDLQDIAARGLELFFAATNGSGEKQAYTTRNNIEESDQTPNEILEKAYQTLRRTLAQELLRKLKQASPGFFERLVVDLLIRMGYGGSIPDAGSVTGRGADGGVDGVIKQDKLGLDVIYLQAKRWSSTVGRPELQAFAGSLEGNRATKGVFITTSQFSPDAEAYVSQIGKKIVLIDGEELSQMMIDHDVGVSVGETYAVKRIDSDYFSEE